MYFCIMISFLLLILPIATRVRVYKNKSYYEQDKVALYIMKYNGHLPPNFITKTQAEEQYLADGVSRTTSLYMTINQGKNIGGDEHRKVPKVNPQDSNILAYYHGKKDLKECDIYDIPHTEIAKNKSRYKHRLVYCVDGSQVFYTTDHYQHFTTITKWEINKTSNSLWIVFSVYMVLEISIVFVVRKNKGFVNDLKTAGKNSLKACIFIVLLPALLIYAIYSIIKESRVKGERK